MDDTPLKILIVDDNAVNRQVLTGLLKKEGYATTTVDSGEAALTSLAEEPVGLILLDIMMPVMDGYEVLTRLKEDPVLCSIPVVMITALEDIDSVVKCIHLGADDYLTKPIKATLLKTRIDNVLSRKKALTAVRKLGSYMIDTKIGEGGMAEVYRASHSLLRRPTAIKILRGGNVTEETISMFEREVQASSSLSHPNTIEIYDYGRTPDGWFYYAMEYLPGINLQDMLKFERRLPEARTIHIMQQICGSLEEAHGQGLIHRDIKPSNIMLCERGGIYDVVKVLDFGIVRSVAEDTHTEHDRYAGTPWFMAPECINGRLSIDARSDIYSLGALVYHMLTGKYLFTAASLSEILKAQTDEIPELPSKKTDAEISPDLEQLIMACLEKDPAKRPPSMREIYDALDKCRNNAGKWNRDDAETWWTDYLKRIEKPQSTAGGGAGATLMMDMNRTLVISLDGR